ncbi:rhodanese-like domain-containing protein [Streptomyces sp. NPDC056049]|uniref:rhodanese-like domain-containing protein n=1 Tax=Streptomyces sp. NPDC056049 TaxID=3345693 RepID=UPI0035D94598
MFLLPRGSGRIPAEQAYRLLRECSAVLLDVREADEYDAGHAPGALHVPLSRLAVDGEVPGSKDGRTLVLICRSGNRSRHAARILAERGVEAVDVTGGMYDWAAQGLPVQDASGAAGTVI